MTDYVRPVAVLVLVAFVAFHWLGVRLASRAQEIMSFIKAVGLLAFVAVCFTYDSDVAMDFSEANTIPIQGSLVIALLAALQSVFYTYDGWHTAAYFTEEDVNPSKNLPRSMMGGVVLIITIYLLVNVAIFHVLPIRELAGSKLAAADAIQRIYGPGAARAVTALLLISILGIINAQIMFNPRVLFAMSRDGLFSRRFATVNAGGTPGAAMVLTAGISIVMILTGSYGRFSDIASFFFVLCYAAGFASLIRLRRTEPDLPRPFRAWGYPVVTWVLLIASLAFLVGVIIGDQTSSLYAIGFLALSYPAYVLVKRINNV